jgi:hypothetical protein
LTRGVEITGSVKLTPASVSTNTQYVIPFISGSTISKDSVDTLFYNPSSNALQVSASANGLSSMNTTGYNFVSGSGAYGTYSSAISKNGFSNSIEGGNYIQISANPSKIGAPSVTNFTKPAILALSSSAQPYVVMELQASGSSFSDGRATFKRKLVAEQGFELTGSFTATIPTASNEGQTNLFNFAPFVGANGTTYSSANVSLQDYASSGIDQTFVIEYANASFEKYTALTVGPTTGGSKAQFSINTGTGYDFDEISLTDNGGGTSTAVMKADTNRIVGATQVTGSLGISSTLTASLQQGYVWVGDASGRTTTVPTSSFGGGGGSTFPYSGTASISGSLQVTGSMSGLVTELTVSSNTASIDFTKGNFFSITLPGGATTRFEVANTIMGQTINIQINQPAGASTGSVAFSPSILFAGGNDYQATATGSAIDLLTLAAITGSTVLATSIKNFL